MRTMVDYINTIHQYYPDFEIIDGKIEKLSGQFNDVLNIDDRWIFRFPKSPHVAPEVAREVKVLRGLQGKLPLPIPNPSYVAYHLETRQLEFMGYAMLAGEPLLREKFATLTDETILEQIAQDIATFLKALHRIPQKAIGLEETLTDNRQAWLRMYKNIKAQLYPHMRPDAQADVTQNFEQALANVDLWNMTPRLIHGDFGTGNILYADGHIVGVIDFTFCAVDDPAQDIGALLSSYGEPFVECVLRYYPELRQSLQRAKFYRSNYALIQALYALRDNDQSEFEDGISAYR